MLDMQKSLFNWPQVNVTPSFFLSCWISSDHRSRQAICTFSLLFGILDQTTYISECITDDTFKCKPMEVFTWSVDTFTVKQCQQPVSWIIWSAVRIISLTWDRIDPFRFGCWCMQSCRAQHRESLSILIFLGLLSWSHGWLVKFGFHGFLSDLLNVSVVNSSHALIFLKAILRLIITMWTIQRKSDDDLYPHAFSDKFVFQ